MREGTLETWAKQMVAWHVTGELWILMGDLFLRECRVVDILIYACYGPFWFRKGRASTIFLRAFLCPNCSHRLLSGLDAILGNCGAVPRIQENTHRPLEKS